MVFERNYTLILRFIFFCRRKPLFRGLIQAQPGGPQTVQNESLYEYIRKGGDL